MKRFGKKRVPDCACTYNFTCKPCLLAAPPYHFTPAQNEKAKSIIDTILEERKTKS